MTALLDLDAVTAAISPQQIRSIVESRDRRICLWTGAVRSGKTVASLLAFLIKLASAPNSGLIIIAGKTLQTIERNVIGPLQDAALFGVVAKLVHHTTGSNTAVILGRQVHLLGANDKGAEGRFRGATVYLTYVDEATLIPESVWNQILARLSPPGAQLIATSNPDGPGHWLRKKFILRAGELDMGHWTFSLDDNPHLDPRYVASLKQEYVGLWYDRFILGKWRLAEGAIFDMWDDRHVVDILPVITRWIGVGVDYGTTNPFAALLLGIGVDGKLYLASEYRHDSRLARRSMTDAEYSQAMRDWLAAVPIPHTQLRGVRPEWTVVDPSAASYLVQLYRDGLTPTPADNSVLDGIRNVATLLGRDMLRVHSSCRGWIEEVGGYSWDPDKAERGEDAPIKAEDHSLDAGRYVIHTTDAIWRTQIGLVAA